MADSSHSKRDAVLARLRELAAATEDYDGDPEDAHMEADKLLLDLIEDDEIRTAFNQIQKWYA